jgi:hypothetical protein
MPSLLRPNRFGKILPKLFRHWTFAGIGFFIFELSDNFCNSALGKRSFIGVLKTYSKIQF